MATQRLQKKGFLRTTAPMVFTAALFIVGMIPLNLLATEILLGTGPEGSFSHFAGRAICRVVNRHASDYECLPIPATGDIHNLTNLQGGSLDLSLVEHSVLHDATKKKGSFEFLDIRYDNLGYMVPVYDQAILLVTRSDADIGSLDEVKGKRINAGAPRSKTSQAVELIMGIKGWTKEDFKVMEALPSSQSQDTMAFCHGSVQVMIAIGVHPDTAFQKLMKLCNAAPVSMDDTEIGTFVKAHPAYFPIRIPVEAYPDLDKPITTFGTTVSLVASGSLDDETVQSIMRVLDARQSVLKQSHPALGHPGVDQADLQDIGVSLHPGAAVFLSGREP